MTAKNIKTEGILLDGITYVTKEVHEEIYSRCDPSFGDVLYIKDGATTGIATINQLKEPFSMLSSVALLKPSEAVFNRYLLWAMRSPFFYAETRGAMKGAAITRVTLSAMASSLLPLPPLAEQKRIVAKVDELMALCERLEVQQSERAERHAMLARAALARFAEASTPANLTWLFHDAFPIPPADLRKAILTLAIQGQLTNNAKTNEGSAVKMRHVCHQITDGEHATPQRTPTGVPLATAKNVRDGFLDLSNTDFVAQITADKCWKRCKPRDQDILMVCVGATTGRVCLAINPPDMVLVRSVALLRPNIERIDPSYLDLFLRSPAGQSQIWSNVKQSAQPCLYLGKMAGFDISLPPIAEQCSIVAKVDHLMALVDELETQLTTSRATAEKLLEALVAELTSAKSANRSNQTEVIELRSSPEFTRTVLAAEIADRIGRDDTFGETKLQKIIHLAEYVFQLPEIESLPRRFTRGPHDPELIAQVEAGMKTRGWFDTVARTNSSGYRYVPLSQAGDQRTAFEKLWPKKADALRQFIDQFESWKTERCERFATLYAAWNDLLIRKQPVTDATVLREVLERWHPDKKKIKEAAWQESLAWMRREKFIPTGFGRATTQQTQQGFLPLSR